MRRRRPPSFIAKTTLCVALTAACGAQTTPSQEVTLCLQTAQASIVADGNFTASIGAPWTVSTATTAASGLLQVPPMSVADLSRVAASTDFTANTTRWVSAPGSLVPQSLDANAGIAMPLTNQSVVAINLNGGGARVSTLSQSFAFTAADLDPSFHRLRLRAIVAPVLSNNPSHTNPTQAYFLARLASIDSNQTNVAQYFLRSGQPEVPWSTQNQNQSFGWQLVELTPSILDVAPGDRVRVDYSAAGCSVGGHFGAAYLDSVGNWALGATSVVARGPEVVEPNATISYVLHVQQQGGPAAGPVALTVAIPSNANFLKFDRPASWSCAGADAVSGGNIGCAIPSLAAGEHAEATLTVRAPASAGIVGLGNYAIAARAKTPLYGPSLMTNVATSANALCNLQVVVNEDVAVASKHLAAAQVVIANAGPSAVANAKVASVAGQALQAIDWHCEATGGASCGGGTTLDGNGPFAFTSSFAVGSTISCRVQLAKQTNQGSATFGVAARAPSGTTDTTAWDSEAVALIDLSTQGVRGACDVDADCASGFCSDGYCCTTRCGAACSACNVPGHEGVCAAIAGEGPRSSACSPYICGEGACLAACDHDEDCVRGLTCQQRVCRPRRNVCNHDADCAQGLFCTPAHTCESTALVDPLHPNWKLEGHGCSHGPSGGTGALAAALALVVRVAHTLRRRRQRKFYAPTLMALFVMLASAPKAGAAQNTAVPTNHFLPAAGVYDVYGSQSASVPLQAGTVRIGLWLNAARSPLRLTTTTLPTAWKDIVRQQATADLLASVVVSRWLEASIALPLVVQQTQAGAWASDLLTQQRTQFGTGDLRIGAKSMLLARANARLGLAATLGVPTASPQPFVGLHGVAVRPMALAEFGKVTGLRVLLNAGAAIRPKRQLLNLSIHHAFTWSAAVHIPWHVSATTQMAARVGTFGESNFTSGVGPGLPSEVVGGLHVNWNQRQQFDVGAGTGFTNGYGAARWRVFLAWNMVHWPAGQGAADPLPPAEQSPPALELAEAAEATLPVAPDRDGDGVPDPADVCPDVPGPSGGARPGCPTTTAHVQAVLAGATLLYFANDSAAIGPRDTASLEQIRQVMQANGAANLVVEGHTDDSGDKQHNVELSKRRAQAAKRWLTEHGIASGRITVNAFGAARPLDTKRNSEARARNRRIRFLLAPPANPPARPARAR